MLAVLSPAKNQRTAGPPGIPLTVPAFEQETRRLAAQLRELAPFELESVLEVGPEIALRAFGYYQEFRWGAPGTAALLAYHGLAYQHLHAEDFTPEEFAFAQDHLRICSALYGLLRPADAILPYRLALQCRLRVDGQSLYAFWGDRICRALFAGGETVVNLASGEYGRTVTRFRRPGDRLITCEFCVMRRGRRITLATGAKMARGEMARYIVKNRLEEPEALQHFAWDGYAFVPALSNAERYVFLQST